MNLPMDIYDPFKKEKYDRTTINGVPELEILSKQLFNKIVAFNQVNGRDQKDIYLADVENVVTGEKRIFNLDPNSPGAYSVAEALFGRTWVVVSHVVPTVETSKVDKSKVK